MSRRASVVLLLPLAVSLASFGSVSQTSTSVEPTRETAGVVESVLDDTVQAVATRLASRGSSLTPAELETVATVIVEQAHLRGFDLALVLAVIEVESGFNAFAVSPVGAVGLMQVMPATGEALAREMGIDWRGARTLFDPVTNVRLGLAYLGQLRDRFGHLPTALAAYNRGPSAIVRRVRSGAPIPAGYSNRVLAARAEAPLRSTSPS